MNDSLTSINPIEALRILNLIAGIVVVIWLMIRRVKHPSVYRDQLRKDLWLMEFYWCMALVVGNLEWLVDTGTTTRTIWVTGALLITLRILWRYDKDWHTAGKKEGQA